METPNAPEAAPAAVAASTPALPPRKKSWGGLIGILLIVAAIILGALYAWGERMALEEARNAAPIE